MENNIFKILAIDDNQDNLISIKALIREPFPDALVFTALNGPKGLETAFAEIPDVILLDIVMPGMDGFEVCQKLKSDKRLVDIPVIFVTALKGDKDSRIKALECGAEAFLAKPIDQCELTAQIRAMLKIKIANYYKYSENERLAALVAERTQELNKTHLATLNLLEDLSKENEARRKSEKAVRESEEKYRAIFENVQDVFYQTDLSGIVKDVSPSIKHFSQFTREEIIGYPVQNIYYDNQDRVSLINELLIKKELRDYEIRLKTKSGEIIYASINARLIFDANGNPDHIDGALRDITKRKKAENDLIYAKEKAEESDRLKSAFLANMSHEIRTPLNGILGFAEMLKDPSLTVEENKEYIKIIEKGANRMLNIINDLIDISKIEAGLIVVNSIETNINEQIEDIQVCFKPEIAKKDIAFVLNNSLSVKDSTIKTDHEKVFAILSNLVKNAIKFTNEGTIEVGCAKKEEFLEFYVKDTGLGILHEHQKLIFERFRQGSESLTRNFEGAGLGLSISKAYAEILGGKLWVESEAGKGSTFFFTIPCN